MAFGQMLNDNTSVFDLSASMTDRDRSFEK